MIKQRERWLLTSKKAADVFLSLTAKFGMFNEVIETVEIYDNLNKYGSATVVVFNGTNRLAWHTSFQGLSVDRTF